MFPQRNACPITTLLLALLLLALCFGCAKDTYQYGLSRAVRIEQMDKPMTVNMGGEHPQLDRLERVVHFPAKKFREWFREDQPKIPDEILQQQAVEKAQEFLYFNQLPGIQVDVREYNPRKQWERLQANQTISPFWKYTAGTLDHIEYCLLPGRVFHRDHYNVFTNTLSINSTSPSRSLYAAAGAKFLLSRNHPGAFESACYLPGVPLYRDYHVASDVLTYVKVREEWELEKQLYPEIYANFGSDTVSQATSVVPAFAYVPIYVKPILRLSGRLVGRSAGNVMLQSREFEKQLRSEDAADSSVPPDAGFMPKSDENRAW